MDAKRLEGDNFITAEWWLSAGNQNLAGSGWICDGISRGACPGRTRADSEFARVGFSKAVGSPAHASLSPSPILPGPLQLQSTLVVSVHTHPRPIPYRGPDTPRLNT